MQVKCGCGAKVLAEDVNLDRLVAKCRGCNSVFPIEVPRPERPPVVATPPRIRVEEAPSELVLSWRWFRPHFLMLAFFCTAWDGFLIFWYTMAFRGNAPWIMIVFPIAHLAVGVGLTYYTLTGFWNRTRITVTRDRLIVRHGPLPWMGNQEVDVASIAQLYGTEGSTHNNSSTYDLNVLTREGGKVKLAGSLSEPDEVFFLERRIEDFLGLEDQPVAGELSK